SQMLFHPRTSPVSTLMRAPNVVFQGVVQLRARDVRRCRSVQCLGQVKVAEVTSPNFRCRSKLLNSDDLPRREICTRRLHADTQCQRDTPGQLWEDSNFRAIPKGARKCLTQHPPQQPTTEDSYSQSRTTRRNTP